MISRNNPALTVDTVNIGLCDPTSGSTNEPWSAFPSTPTQLLDSSNSTNLLSSSLPSNIGFLRRPQQQRSQQILGFNEDPNSPRTFVMETLDTIKHQIQRSEVLPKKKRKKTSPDQYSILSRAFQINPKPTAQERTALANDLGMNPRAVQVWFQNRRMKHKSQYGFTPEASYGKTIISGGDTPETASGMTLMPLSEVEESQFSRSHQETSFLSSFMKQRSMPMPPSTSSVENMIEDLALDQNNGFFPRNSHVRSSSNTPAMDNFLSPPSMMVSPLHPQSDSMQNSIQNPLLISQLTQQQFHQNQMANSLINSLHSPHPQVDLINFGDKYDSLISPPSAMDSPYIYHQHQQNSQYINQSPMMQYHMNRQSMFGDASSATNQSNSFQDQNRIAQDNLLKMFASSSMNKNGF